MTTQITQKSKEWMLGLNVSHLVRHHRRVKMLTQKQLADIVGTQQSAIARIERDEYLPSLSELIKIAEALDKTVEVRFK